MKLRSLWIGNYRSLQDLQVQLPDQPRLPIHLLVGVNGTGKSGIFRAMARILTALENRQAPHIPFRLAYQISVGGETYEVDITGDGSGTITGVMFNVNDLKGTVRALDSSEWETFLPAQTVIYTSGNLTEWEPVFTETSPEADRRERDRAELLNEMQTNGHPLEEVTAEAEFETATSKGEVQRSRVRLITHAQLQLALLATLALEEAPGTDLRMKIYRRAKLERLTRFALQLEPVAKQDLNAQAQEQFILWLRGLMVDRYDDRELRQKLEELESRPTPVVPRAVLERVQKLAKLAVHRHRNPDGSYHLRFDMTQETRLGLGGDQGLFSTPLQFYDEVLTDLQNRGVLTRVDLVLQKTDLKGEILDRHLSDGEFEFLGRMALFMLLRQRESLFLLDEPETHFNDVWKRELVDILAEILADQSSAVLLTTHSSIIVSDVSNDQVTLLKKDEQGITRVVDLTSPTLGADPSEIMISVLEAPDSTGVSGLEYLDSQLRREWTPADQQELEELIRKTGPGYHRSELRAIWRKLNAPQDSTTGVS
jgi:ABC-type Mn2+/Zn2+ transport system ATPase subunit